MTTELRELKELGVAITDTTAAADAVCGLREELKALGAHVSVDPALRLMKNKGAKPGDGIELFHNGVADLHSDQGGQ